MGAIYIGANGLEVFRVGGIMPVDSAVIPTDIEIDATDIYFAD